MSGLARGRDRGRPRCPHHAAAFAVGPRLYALMGGGARLARRRVLTYSNIVLGRDPLWL